MSSEPTFDLREILGHDREDAKYPVENQERWLGESILRSLKSLEGGLKGRIVFIDLLFARVEDGAFFGSIVARDDRRVAYSDLLKELFSSRVTVGSHNLFREGFLSPSDSEQWLYSFRDTGTLDAGTDGASTPCELAALPIKAGELLAELGMTLAQLVDEASRKTVLENWTQFIERSWTADLTTAAGSPLNAVAGVPLVIPPAGGSVGFPVASLFLGLASSDRESGKGDAIALARHLIPLALRTYAVQRALQASQFEGARQAQRVYESIKPLVQTLIEQTADFRQTALRIGSAITLSGHGFLAHGDALSRIFQAGLESHYGYGKKTGEHRPEEFAFHGLHAAAHGVPESQADIALTRYVVTGVHDCKSPAEWAKLATFFTHYGNAHSLQLCLEIAETAAGDSIKTKKLHDLAKLLFHRNRAPWVSELQLLVAAGVAWRNTPGTKRLVLKQGSSETLLEYSAEDWKVRRLNLSPLLELDEKLFTRSEEDAAELRGNKRASDVLSALMLLIAEELVPGKQDGGVEASHFYVLPATAHVDVWIGCSGRFTDIRDCELELDAGNHGLRSCLEVLATAVGQKQPALVHFDDLENFQAFADKSWTSSLAVGQTPDRKNSALFIRFRRLEKVPSKPEGAGTGSPGQPPADSTPGMPRRD